jgi:HEAT repeat protein
MESAPKSLDRLVRIIQDHAGESIEQRLLAVSELGENLSHEANEVGMACLIDCLRKERDAMMVARVVSILAMLKAETAAPVLVDVLLATDIAVYEDPKASEFVQTDESTRLRCNAARALGAIGDTRAIVPLMSILNNKAENYRLRLAAAESLGKVGDEYVVKPLIDILADEREKSVYLKESVAHALGMLGDIRAVEPLIEILESKRGIRDKFNFLKERVIEAVARIGRPSRKITDGLLEALSDEAPSIRLAAVEALGELGDPSCVEKLQARVFDENDDVAKAAIFVIYNLAGEEAVRELLSRENLPLFLRDELEGYIP